MVGIYDCFGYGTGYDVPFAERYRLIKEAGFDCVMLWWSDRFGRGDGYRNDISYARGAGLGIENIHAPVHEQNALSCDSPSGEHVFSDYRECIRVCAENGIQTVVIHAPDDCYPIGPLGLERLAALISEAENRKVRIAFENLSNQKNLETILETFCSGTAGLCFDTCHHRNYTPDTDYTELNKNRFFAVHQEDNGSKRNQHQLPFDGMVDWASVMRKIGRAGYSDPTMLEPMNWDYEKLTIRQFLSLAYQRAMRLDKMRVR